MNTTSFPDGFVWGSATSAYQVEGAMAEGGKGRSIWDDFAHAPGRIRDGSHGDIAVDHYHRYPEDIALMKSLGLRAYRFSTSWPRVLPEGTGRLEPRGLDFYSRLVDALLESGIEPYLTLYHWDLPAALQARGGWANRDIAGWFADYAAVMARALGDRVKHWITVNEPWCVSFLSHEIGEHAPGLRDKRLAIQAAHHVNLAHGMGAIAIRAATPNSATTRVGAALNFVPVMALTESEADQRAAALAAAHDPFIGWFARPILTGAYEPLLLAAAGHDAPEVKSGDMALIAQRLDFLGVNYYNPTRIRDNGGAPAFARRDGAEFTLMDWEVEPAALFNTLLGLKALSRGNVPMHITENGASFRDAFAPDGAIHDDRRVAYFRSHLSAVRDAISAGVDVRGYFVWSLLDNFEWAHGYQQFFGIVHVDFATQKRTVKDSGRYIRAVIAANAALPA